MSGLLLVEIVFSLVKLFVFDEPESVRFMAVDLVIFGLLALIARRKPAQPLLQLPVLADPGVHGDAGGDAGVDRPGRAELGDRQHAVGRRRASSESPRPS